MPATPVSLSPFTFDGWIVPGRRSLKKPAIGPFLNADPTGSNILNSIRFVHIDVIALSWGVMPKIGVRPAVESRYSTIDKLSDNGVPSASTKHGTSLKGLDFYCSYFRSCRHSRICFRPSAGALFLPSTFLPHLGLG